MDGKNGKVKGWTYPTETANKSHYFDFAVSNRSLCGKYMMIMWRDEWIRDRPPDPLANTSHQCRECRRRLIAQQEKASKSDAS